MKITVRFENLLRITGLVWISTQYKCSIKEARSQSYIVPPRCSSQGPDFNAVTKS